MNQLKRLTESLLDPRSPAYSLRPEVVEMTAILASSQTSGIARQKDITHRETRTASGLAVSPTMAIMCIDDYVRTIQFIRGTHAAIVAIRKRISGRPVRILYAGCGPYATLAVPLMTIFSPNEATFSILDVHPESIASAKSIVDTLGFADSVAGFATADAGSYKVGTDWPPDIILMEIMNVCLKSEPQVAVTRHLLRQAPQAILVPEEIRVDLTLVNPSREFDPDCLEQERAANSRDRIPVASVFVVNRETVHSWGDQCSERLPASAVQMPAFPEHRYEPMLFTVIRIYEDHVLKDYDSGLTCPRPLSIEGAIKPGDTIRFHYELGSHPRLHYTLEP